MLGRCCDFCLKTVGLCSCFDGFMWLVRSGDVWCGWVGFCGACRIAYGIL